MYTATVHVKGNAELILRSFAAEDKVMGKRSEYTVKKDKKGVLFTVNSQDSTALRAQLNTITKMLTVIEGMESL